MALVESPVAPHREPGASGRVQGDLGGADRPGQDRGVQDPQVQVGLEGQEFPGASGLGLAQGREVDVGPAGEEIQLVPRRLAVAQENKVRHAHQRTFGHRDGVNRRILGARCP